MRIYQPAGEPKNRLESSGMTSRIWRWAVRITKISHIHSRQNIFRVYSPRLTKSINKHKQALRLEPKCRLQYWEKLCCQCTARAVAAPTTCPIPAFKQFNPSPSTEARIEENLGMHYLSHVLVEKRYT